MNDMDQEPEINISFTQRELSALLGPVLRLLEDTQDDDAQDQRQRVCFLTAAVKIALGEDRFDEFETTAIAFFDRTKKLKPIENKVFDFESERLSRKLKEHIDQHHPDD